MGVLSKTLWWRSVRCCSKDFYFGREEELGPFVHNAPYLSRRALHLCNREICSCEQASGFGMAGRMMIFRCSRFGRRSSMTDQTDDSFMSFPVMFTSFSCDMKRMKWRFTLPMLRRKSLANQEGSLKWRREILRASPEPYRTWRPDCRGQSDVSLSQGTEDLPSFRQVRHVRSMLADIW